MPIPVKLVHLNKCPILAPLGVLTPDALERTQIDKSVCLERQAQLKQDSQVREKMDFVFSEGREFAKNPDVDQQLYDGFFSPADKAQMRIIRDANPEALGSLDIQLGDERIKPLLFRYRARHYFHTLTDQEQRQWLGYCRDKFEQELPDYMLNLERLGEEHQADEKKMRVLKAVFQYVQKLVS